MQNAMLDMFKKRNKNKNGKKLRSFFALDNYVCKCVNFTFLNGTKKKPNPAVSNTSSI